MDINYFIQHLAMITWIENGFHLFIFTFLFFNKKYYLFPMFIILKLQCRKPSPKKANVNTLVHESKNLVLRYKLLNEHQPLFRSKTLSVRNYIHLLSGSKNSKPLRWKMVMFYIVSYFVMEMYSCNTGAPRIVFHLYEKQDIWNSLKKWDYTIDFII
jgi:hypothetical protein